MKPHPDLAAERLRFRPRLEALEHRQLLAADLQILDAYLVDGQGERLEAVLEGQQVRVRVDYETSDLQENDSYRILFAIDGVAIQSELLAGTTGTGVSQSHIAFVGYAAPENLRIDVGLDVGDLVAEEDETNNSLQFQITPAKAQLPQKLLFPTPGVAGEDWTIVNYVDVDPRPGVASDYAGGFFTHDWHDDWDIGLANHRGIDQGQSVVAAADGIVTSLTNAFADRGQENGFNSITIDHGDGWETVYRYLQRDSIAVNTGQRVTQGETIALVGSSGSPDFAHLSFMVRKDGLGIEPAYATEDYFLSSPAYTGDQEVLVLDSGLTNSNPTDTSREQPVPIDTFPQLGGDNSSGVGNPWIWYITNYVEVGDRFRTTWTRPDGSVAFDDHWTSPIGIRHFIFWAWTGEIDQTGEWTVVSTHEDREIYRSTFKVVLPGDGEPALDVTWGDRLIIDERLTPIDAGTYERGESSSPTSLTLRNAGSVDLEINDVRLPEGFQLAEPAPQVVPAGEERELKIALETDAVDRYWGQVELETNDPDEAVFNFPIEGHVTGARAEDRPFWTPTFRLPIAIKPGEETVNPFNLALVDQDGSDFSGGRVRAGFVSGASAEQGDSLQFVAGSGFVQQGNQILRSGEVIAEIVDSDPQAVELLFAEGARTSDATILAQMIQFQQQNGELDDRQRILSLKAVDPDGNPSNTIYRSVYYAQASYLQLPSDVVVAEDETARNLGAVEIVSASPDTYQYTTNDSRFSVQNGELNFAGEVDYETEPVINLVVTATDSSGKQTSARSEVAVGDINEAPESVSINNNTIWQELIGQVVGQLNVVDPELDQTHVIESLDSKFVVEGGFLRLAADQFIPAGMSEYIVPLRVTDSGSPALSVDFQIQVLADAIDSPWKNQALPSDVNGDGTVAPIDALIVINYLNLGRPQVLDPDELPPLATGFFYDRNGDRVVSPLDALIIISELNEQSSGEGEAITQFAFSDVEDWRLRLGWNHF